LWQRKQASEVSTLIQAGDPRQKCNACFATPESESARGVLVGVGAI
jgi:hypothetical protein